MDYTKTKEEYLKDVADRCKLKGFSEQTIKSYSYNFSWLVVLEKKEKERTC